MGLRELSSVSQAEIGLPGTCHQAGTSSAPEFSLYRPREGHPDWGLLFEEARRVATEVLPELERPRWTFPRRLRSYATTARNFVYNRRLHACGREDLRPLYFIWTLTRVCNFRCTYCDDHRGRKYPDLPNDGVLSTEQGRQLLRIMRSRTPSVYFAGGEPTARLDLPELTREAASLGYFPIIINTNGSLIERRLRRKDWSDWLANTDIVVVSLDGLDLDAMAAMWVTRKPADVMRNLLILRELSGPMKFKLMVNTVIQPGRTGAAREVLDFANDLGIWFCPVPVNVGPTVDGTLANDEGYHELVELILQRKREGYRITGSLRMNERLLYSHRLQCRNTLKPHIDYDGHLFWPCKASVNREPVRLNVLDFAHVDDLYAHGRRLLNPDRFHGPGADQCGANCNWAQNYSTDAYVHGLEHPSALLGDVREFLRR